MKRARTAVVVTLLLASLAQPLSAGIRSGRYLGGLRGIKDILIVVETWPQETTPDLQVSDIWNIVLHPLANVGIVTVQQNTLGQAPDVPKLTVSAKIARTAEDDRYVCQIAVTLTGGADQDHVAMWDRTYADTIKQQDVWVMKAELTAMVAALVMDYLCANQVLDDGGGRLTGSGVYDFRYAWGKDGSSSQSAFSSLPFDRPLATADDLSGDSNGESTGIYGASGSVSGGFTSFSTSSSFSSSSSGSVSSGAGVTVRSSAKPNDAKPAVSKDGSTAAKQ